MRSGQGREIWLVIRLGELQKFGLGPSLDAEGLGSPGPWPLTTSSLASQEPQLLGAESSVVSCLLEGPVQLGPGSVLQHCHLQVRPESRARGRAGYRGRGLCVLAGVTKSHARMPDFSSPRALFTLVPAAW